MTQTQLEAVQHMLRNRPVLDLATDLTEQRRLFDAMRESTPLPDGTTTTDGELGGVPVVLVEGPNTGSFDSSGSSVPVVLYFHGGGYVLGTAATGVALAVGLAARVGGRGISVGYRLAPEHPFPAAVEDALAAYRALLDDGVSPSRIAFAGDSAGGGLAVAALIAARDAGLPLPSAAVAFSPWTDLTLAGASVTGRADDDLVLTADILVHAAADYLGSADPRSALASPGLTADLSGLPPLLIQVGSHEILLDDAIALAARAAAFDVPVDLQIGPGLPHVFQRFAGTGRLDQADAAMDAAGDFLRRALASAPVISGQGRGLGF
ncbi:alpha/beta hydrolase [Streptacidiphilus sp. EB103A]|uniref:alpha/beta hydrolase n=1 Tax=Streptacidiphilus sp. EB103A TaxID=3156275 RepID=UPI003517E22F